MPLQRNSDGRLLVKPNGKLMNECCCCSGGCGDCGDCVECGTWSKVNGGMRAQHCTWKQWHCDFTFSCGPCAGGSYDSEWVPATPEVESVIWDATTGLWNPNNLPGFYVGLDGQTAIRYGPVVCADSVGPCPADIDEAAIPPVDTVCSCPLYYVLTVSAHAHILCADRTAWQEWGGGSIAVFQIVSTDHLCGDWGCGLGPFCDTGNYCHGTECGKYGPIWVYNLCDPYQGWYEFWQYTEITSPAFCTPGDATYWTQTNTPVFHETTHALPAPPPPWPPIP